MRKPDLTFFCELTPQPLWDLFADPVVIPTLQKMGAAVSLGLLDFSPERAEVVKLLNQSGIPVTGWMLLPKEQGYWLNLDNAPQAFARYTEFKVWSQQNGLEWQAVGLDIEPDINMLQRVAEDRTKILQILKKAFSDSQLKRSKQIYEILVKRMRQDGYLVESYQFPFIMDERKARSTLLQRTTGILDLPVDREVLMLYSSFTRSLYPGLLWTYGKEAQAIGLGSTGGGVEMDGLVDIKPLSWDELYRDVIIAAQCTQDLYIFSLEGCVQQGYLSNIAEIPWEEKNFQPIQGDQRIRAARSAARGLLWLGNRPYLILLPLLAVLGWLFRKKPKK